jgi:alpha-mannosidase
LDNGRIRMELDPESGYLSHLFDYRENAEVLEGSGAKPVVVRDTSDTWGHNAYRFNDEIGAFKATAVELVADGPVKAVIRVSSEYGRSRLVQEFAIYANSTLIEVNTHVDWREQFKMLKIRFPTRLHLHKVTHEIPYGHIERFANGEEEPLQSWLDISGASRETNERYGLSILNDSKYSADVFVHDIGLTVLRSPIYAHHVPKVPEPEGFYSFMDQGTQRFTYAIYPHVNGWEEARTVQRAAELNQRPVALITTYHSQGTLPQVNSFATVDDDNVIISVLKQWEDGEDLILRACETTRMTTTATISLPQWGRAFTAEFKPCEIKTFRIPLDTSKKVVEVNMLEWEMTGESA